jgi:FkbM family methyltransferase
MRELKSLSEFDDFVRTLDSMDESEKMYVLGNSYLADPDIVAMPPDPFSNEYRDQVLRIHAKLSGRERYDATTMEHTPLDIAAQAKRPAVYSFDSVQLGQFFESYGHVMKVLAAKEGMRILELGCGDAQISLHLARMGCDVTAVDIEPGYVELVKTQARMLETKITALQGGFMSGVALGKFDRIFFYQAFHHSLEHQDLLAALPDMLTDDGFAVFATEPIIDPAGGWGPVVPYPWGPRLDGLSLRAMRVHGWMELGFQNAYFDEALRRAGFTSERFSSPTNGLVFSVTARRIGLVPVPQTLANDEKRAEEQVSANSEAHAGEQALAKVEPRVDDSPVLSAIKEVDLGIRTVKLTGHLTDRYFENIQAYVSGHPELLSYARKHLAPGSICLDIGANIGITTILMCLCCPEGHVYSFEPSPVNAKLLRQNLELNGIRNCTVIEVGLGAKSEILAFHVNEFGAGSHFVTDAHMDKDRRETIQVPVVSLDEYMTRSDAPKRVDFIKIDAEGFEPAVLAGAAQTIMRYAPPIFMEFNSWSLYFAHRFDPYLFASALWDTFDVLSVTDAGALVPAADGDVRGFLFYNMTAHSCVDDVLLRLKPGRSIPALSAMVDPAANLRLEVAQLRLSTSWRITAPLRALATAARSMYRR